MQVLCGKDGYVENFAVVGNLTGGVEAEEPEDIGHFRAHFQSYRIEDDRLIFDPDRDQVLATAEHAEEIRRLREAECFPIVNRGQFWYERLTEQQRSELDAWYKAWLDATETGAIPDKPEWL